MTTVDDPLVRRVVERLDTASGGTRRADARRNALRVVAAAYEAVDEIGVEADSHDIARRAGVGVGTFYRNVGSLPDLLAVILDELLDQLIATGERCLADEDAWHGFTAFASDFVQLGHRSCGVKDAVQGQRVIDLDPQIGAIRSVTQRIVERAQAAGELRADVDWHDVACVLASVIPSERTLALEIKPDQWRRSLDIVLAGLRSPGRGV